MDDGLELRFTYVRGRGKEKSILLQKWNKGKPTNHVVCTQHLTADHPHELFHNYRDMKTKDLFIGVGLKYKIMDEENDE